MKADGDEVAAHVLGDGLVLNCFATLGKKAASVHGGCHLDVVFKLSGNGGAGDVLDGENADDFRIFVDDDEAVNFSVNDSI